MYYLISVRNKELNKPVMQGTRVDEDGAEAIFRNFTNTGNYRVREFMQKLKDEGASTYEAVGDNFTVTAMKVDA